MANVYLALKRSVVFVLLLFCQAAFAQPVINSFSPASAWPGLPVTISGSGFSPVAGNNIVYFGPVRAAVQVASTTALYVTVPVGATYAPITVTVNGLTTYSPLPFNVRFQNVNTTLDTNAFGSRKDVYGFNNPRSIALADLNNDGRTDLFVTSQVGNAVSVLRNTSVPGTMRFASGKIPGGPGAFGTATGDFDGDGKLDIAYANFVSTSTGSVQVLRNTSVGDTIRFDTTAYATGAGSTRVAIADIDRDGKPDMLVTSSNSGIVSIFRNTTTVTGSISFAPKIDLTAFNSNDVAVADIDGDGKPELLTLYNGISNGGLSVWKNLSVPGIISFATKVDYPTGSYPILIKVGDLNEDGKQDIVVVNYSSSSMSIFRNRSTLNNILLDLKQDIATGSSPRSAAIGDVNGDGRADIAIGCDTPQAICVYPGIWSDSIKLGARVDYKTGSQLNDIAIGDIDGDGKVDLSFTNVVYMFAVSILRNKQNGELPIINSFTPASAGTGTFVSIFGKNLSTTSSVKFGSQWADSVHVVSDSVVQARVYKGATGDITLYTRYGTAIKPGFTYIGDTTNVPDSTCPVITSFWPTSGQYGTAVYILGSNFTGSSAVRFGGVPADSIVIMSDTMIKAIVDTGATGSVQVITPFCSASKPGFTFIRDTTHTPDTTVFAIYNFTPKSGTKGTVVTIFGSGFNKAYEVLFGGVRADSLRKLSDTVIQARVGSGASGAVTVLATNGSRSLPGFTYIPDTTSPIIGNFWPRSGQRGTIVQILGNRLGSTTAVQFGGVPADSIWVTSDTTVKAIVGNGASGKVSVTTPYGTASLSGFTYIADTTNIPDTTCPVITSFWPTSGPRGTEVYILGSNFTGSSAVRFGGVPADSIVIMSDTMIKAIVDTGATGSVQVIAPYCSASKPGFTFIRDTTNNPDTIPAPRIISFSPTSAQKGNIVTLFGTNFTGATAVYFGWYRADSIVVLSDSVVLAKVGDGGSGTVLITTPAGSGYQNYFTFIGDTTTPTVSSFYPTSGQHGTVVQILGKNLRTTTAVRFGGVAADSAWITSDTTVSAIVGNGATGSVSVTTTYGAASKPGFTYISDTTVNDTLFVNARTAVTNGVIQKSFKLYPNPASKYVTWQQPLTNHKTHLQLVDMYGRVVRQIEVGSNTPQATIQLHGLMAGVYKLVYIDGKNKITSTLLIK